VHSNFGTISPCPGENRGEGENGKTPRRIIGERMSAGITKNISCATSPLGETRKLLTHQWCNVVFFIILRVAQYIFCDTYASQIWRDSVTAVPLLSMCTVAPPCSMTSYNALGHTAGILPLPWVPRTSLPAFLTDLASTVSFISPAIFSPFRGSRGSLF